MTNAPQPITKAELLEQVRVNLLRMLERDRHLSITSIASSTGYSYTAVTKYVNGDRMTPSLASAIVRAIPEAGRGLVCPHCGSLTFM